MLAAEKLLALAMNRVPASDNLPRDSWRCVGRQPWTARGLQRIKGEGERRKGRTSKAETFTTYTQMDLLNKGS